MDKELKKYLPDGKFSGVSEKRSKYMAAVKGKHNRSTELKLRMALTRYGISGWQLHAKSLPGKPDFYFEAENLAVFVDGCFWHGCPKCGHIPKTRREFWEAKIQRNKDRDARTTQALESEGYQVLRFWEHELKQQQDRRKVIQKIEKVLRNG